MSEIEELEKATRECYDMYCQAVETCLYDEKKLDLLKIPLQLRDAIRRSWEEDDLSLYGRFDFCTGARCSETFWVSRPYADIIAGGLCLSGNGKKNVSRRQISLMPIHENLVQSWKDIHSAYLCDKYYFASIADCTEDNATLDYIIATAIEAGLQTYELDIRDVRHCENSLYAPVTALSTVCSNSTRGRRWLWRKSGRLHDGNVLDWAALEVFDVQ